MPSHLGPELVGRAIELRGLGHSQKPTAYMLGVTQGAVSKVLCRHRKTGDTTPRPRSGRPRVTTPTEDRSLVRMQLRSRFQSAPSLQAEWETGARRPPSVQTVRRRLASVGIRGYRPARVPALTPNHLKISIK